jgi:hypothetical protein
MEGKEIVMRKPVFRFIGSVLVVGVLLVIVPFANAQEKCLPLSGTIYFWYTDTWYGTAEFTIGRDVLHASIVANNTSFVDGGVMALGTEYWTLNFGGGNTIHVTTHFTIEHMTDAVSSSGVMHVIEVGRFTKGKGVFQNAYGNLTANGPFGPAVKLPNHIHPAADSVMFAVTPTQGTICMVGGQ